MKERIRFYWAQRSPREQRLLLVMAGLFALVIIWLVVVRPVSDQMADARERHDRAVIALAEAKAQADAIAMLERGGPAAPTIPINLFVSQKASEAGFTVERVTPEGANVVTLNVAAVRAQAFFAWAADLERRDGLIVERMTARANADKTLAVEISFRARSR